MDTYANKKSDYPICPYFMDTQYSGTTTTVCHRLGETRCTFFLKSIRIQCNRLQLILQKLTDLSAQWMPNDLSAQWMPNDLSAQWMPNDPSAQWMPNDLSAQWMPNDLSAQWMPNDLSAQWMPNDQSAQWMPTLNSNVLK